MENTHKAQDLQPKNEKVLEKLASYIDTKKAEEEKSYAKWYKDSKLYKPPTLEDCFEECIASDIEKFQTALTLNKNISHYMEYFDEKAKLYGSSWFDEDLNCYRSGYEEESSIYAYLQSLATEACEQSREV